MAKGREVHGDDCGLVSGAMWAQTIAPCAPMGKAHTQEGSSPLPPVDGKNANPGSLPSTGKTQIQVRLPPPPVKGK